MFQDFEPVHNHKIDSQLTCEKSKISKATLQYRLNHKWDIELARLYPVTAPRIHFEYVGIDGKTRYRYRGGYCTVEELIAKHAPKHLALYRITNPKGLYNPIDRDSDVD